MQYRLRTLMWVSTFAPPALALLYWTVEFLLGVPLRGQIYLVFLALSAYSCWSLWKGLNRMLSGPSAAESWKRRPRRRVRYRIERLAGEST